MRGELKAVCRTATGVATLVAMFVAVLLVLPSGASAKTVWLCKPGVADNPCTPDLSTTQISPTGEALGTTQPKPREKPKFDCFYVYPTVSDDEGVNSDRSIDPEERSIALYQASRYSQRCRVFAPMYRQLTLGAIFSGSTTPEQQALAYGDVVDAWKTYLRKYNNGRGIVLIGHSQGSLVLEQLIADQIDPKPRLQKRIISALLLGGNVLTDEGKQSGSALQSLEACKRPKQTGCVVGFSTFDAPVPADAVFGRPGDFLGGDPETQDVLCNNPAALGGKKKVPLDTVMPTEPFAPGTTIGAGTLAVGFPSVSGLGTTYAEADGAYLGRCSSADDADVLQIEPTGGAPDLNAVPTAGWGLHLIDANIALGNLVDLVKTQAAAYLKRR